MKTTTFINGRTEIRQAGWTLAELMVAMAIASIMMAGLITGSITIQRSFMASRHHIDAQAQQMRLMDYMTLDLRRALTVDAGNGVLTLTVRDNQGNENQVVRVFAVTELFASGFE